MVVKTFNLEDEVYKRFSDFCKENGLSMSQQVNLFIKSQIETSPKVRQEYLERLEKVRKERFMKLENIEEFKKRYS